VVVGPTAAGKTELAQALAERRGAAVLSADSMQIYRGMDIGTGKIPPHERTVPYFGLDIADPGQPYSAALFQAYGREVIRFIDAQGGQCILCGGTGFYVRAVVDDYRFPAGEQTGNAVRDEYMARIDSEGAHAVWEELLRIDPASAQIIHENDVKRVIRAFELLHEGTSYARQREQLRSIPQLYPAVFIGLSVTPSVLAGRIERRVAGMVDNGLVDEVRTLLSRGLRGALTSSQAIGYKEIVAALDGAVSMDEAVERIVVATRQYAKRQRTWFRKDKRIHWLDADEFDLTRLTAESEAILA
jgi:tRNA dimethylallyltransferase